MESNAMSDLLATVDGLLIDIDGVLVRGSEVIPGAAEAIQSLRARHIPLRFVTNTTVYCRNSLLDRMVARGFLIEENELFTATYAAARYLHSHNARSYYPLLLPDAQLEFAGLEVDEENPEFVVIGDMGSSFTFPRLNKAFRAVLNGAQLVALHKKRSWRSEEGMFLDGGPFVVALEYATETGAVVIGKPSQTYFRMVLDDLGLLPARVAVIGDDIEIDVRGAQLMGMQGWLVKSGRFRKEDLGRGIWPDRLLDNIAEIVGDIRHES
jgi:phospholysine phosphohistidine inorganic pyrophosphate phosphatase